MEITESIWKVRLIKKHLDLETYIARITCYAAKTLGWIIGCFNTYKELSLSRACGSKDYSVWLGVCGDLRITSSEFFPPCLVPQW